MAFGHTEPGDRFQKRLQERFEVADKLHRVYRQRWEHFYALYRGFTDWQGTNTPTGQRDVYDGLREARRLWGAELFIPRTFATIETIVPRMLSNRPKMLILPTKKDEDQNALNMRHLIDSQQQKIRFELTLQETVKTALILGLGVEKVAWCNTERNQKRLKQPIYQRQDEKGAPIEWVEGDPEKVTIFDDPNVWDVDPFDFLWDPYASSLDDARYLFHRMWRDTAYVWNKIQSGEWTPLVQTPLTLEDVEGSSSATTYDEIMGQRLRSSSLGRYEASESRAMHEVLEFHDGENVVLWLDRQIVVNAGTNTSWDGGYPFLIYRPTTAGTKQLPGIGEVEPMEHLQLELNELRSQRRDNATIKLNAPLVFWEGKIRRQDLKWGPGMAIPSTTNPEEAIKQLVIGDIPGSAYQESQEIVSDMETVSGVSDPVTGADAGAAETATGVQLVQAAANMRIQNKTRRAEIELAEGACGLFISLNQQHIVAAFDLRVPAMPTPHEPDRRYLWFRLTPDQLAGQFEYDAEGGSTAPENVAQMRADAQMWSQLAMSPVAAYFDPEKLAEKIAENMGIENPQGFVRPPVPAVPQSFPEAMLVELEQGMNIDPQTAEQIIQHALQQAQAADAQQQGSGQGAPPNGAPQNGSQPEPATGPPAPTAP